MSKENQAKPMFPVVKVPRESIAGQCICPYCGNLNPGFIQQFIDQQEKDGKFKKDEFPGALLGVQFFNQAKAQNMLADRTTFPVLQIAFDICSNPECMGIYALSVTQIEGVAMRGPAPGQLPAMSRLPGIEALKRKGL